jgi:L-iditol 2-dehydrogenase
MRAVVFHSPGEVSVDEVPTPGLPEGGLLVDTSYVGVCGSDVRTWRHGNARIDGAQTLGHEVSGVIAASDAPGYEVGTRVAVCPGVPCLACEPCQRAWHNLCLNRRVLGYDFPGGMAESFAVPREAVRAGCVVPLPDSLSTEHAALAEPLHTVLNGQDRARTAAGESVLVLGLGPIGTLHAAVAASRGAAPVLGLDPLPQRAEAARAVLGEGAAEVLDDGSRAGLRERGGRLGWDVVVVATAAHPAFDLALEVVSPRGRVLAFSGLPASAAMVDVNVSRLHYQEIELIGAFGGTPRYYREAVRWLGRTEIDLDRMVGKLIPLAVAVDAFERVERGEGLKTLITTDAKEVVAG